MTAKAKKIPQVQMMATEKLIPCARNAKKHDDGQVAKIAGSIREFGFNNPVLIDGDGSIIAGHGRVLAARKLGLDSVPCIVLDHLSENQKRAYMLADNRLAEIGGGWDMEMLKIELAELADADIDLDALGFGEDFGAEPDFAPGTEEDQGKLDELSPKLVKCPHCNQVFDSRGHEQN